MLVVSPIQFSPVEITPLVRVSRDEVGEQLAVNPLGPNPVRVEAAAARSTGTAWLCATGRTLSPPGAGRILAASSLPGHGRCPSPARPAEIRRETLAVAPWG
jgi:hypothetical protein